MDYFPPRIGFRIDKNFAVSLIFSKEESVDRSALKDAARFSRFPNILGNADILGRMAQLVEHIVHIDGVTGSSPVATTTRLASLLVRFFLTLPSYAKGCESHGEIRLS